MIDHNMQDETMGKSARELREDDRAEGAVFDKLVEEVAGVLSRGGIYSNETCVRMDATAVVRRLVARGWIDLEAP